MAENSINLVQSYILNGTKFNAPIDWEDVEIKADFEGDAIQPNITVDSLTFTLEARERILQWIQTGNIFEGLPIDINLNNINNQPELFSGYLDLVNGFADLPDDGTLECQYVQADGLDEFFRKIETVSYGYLESIGVFTDSDYTNLDYVVEKPLNVLELITTSITLYLMVKELQEQIRRIADDIAVISGILVAGITGSVGALIVAVAKAILNLIYAVAIVIAIKNLATNLFDFLVGPKRTHKVISLNTLLVKVANYYGYQMEFTDGLFNNIYYLPSNINLDEPNKLGIIRTPRGTSKGIPNAQDIGYIVSDMFDRAKKLIDGKFTIQDGTIQLRPKSDPYWIQQSTYRMPSVLIKKKEYNAEDLKSTNVLSFETDTTDVYTVDNFKGTIIEVKTDVISAGNQRNVLLQGLNDIQLGLALGNRKQSLNALENTLKTLGGVIDGVIRAFGGSARFERRVKSRIGALKVSQNNTSVPKLIYLNGSTIPSNHRDFLSAPALWNKYYGEESFVKDNFRGQKVVYRGVEVPFGIPQYKRLLKSSYFYTAENQQAKVINFTWKLGQDTAIIDFWVREVYTTNLKEIVIIPE